MRKFDTKVQYHKYKVLREVARHAWADTLLQEIFRIPKTIAPGPKPTMRCCVYKERAILQERVKLAIGGDINNPNVIEVIEIACDECPMGGYQVSEACRGCMAHRCEDVCRKGAITFDNHQKAHIDKAKCIECGACAKVCPYNAIVNHIRPCINACKIKAISISENLSACIDNDKCTSCGACVYTCPFGAIMDKSFILDVINIIKSSQANPEQKVYAVIAPSIASQFKYAKLEQVVSGIKELGFHFVVEAALGADMVAYSEAEELAEKGFLTSSCCPAFVKYAQSFPNLKDKISTNLSPAAAISKYIKEKDENAKVVFIGPCTAKKMEFRKENVRPYIDSVITFEELQALFDSRDIDINSLKGSELDSASYFGRIFARCGGLSDAVAQALKEQGREDFELNPMICDGIEECRSALMRADKNLLKNNFVEGMACPGGCVGGAGCLTHGERNKLDVNRYGTAAQIKTISDSLSRLEDQDSTAETL